MRGHRNSLAPDSALRFAVSGGQRVSLRDLVRHEQIRRFGNRGRVTTLLRPLWIDQEGQDLAEYALLIVLIALIAAATLKTIGSSINNIFSNTASNLSAT